MTALTPRWGDDLGIPSSGVVVPTGRPSDRPAPVEIDRWPVAALRGSARTVRTG